MKPQFFPWLFDDKNAWEKSFADPRYSYELPIDCFTAIYQEERKTNNATGDFVLPSLPTPAMSLPAASPAVPVQPFAVTMPLVQAQAVAAAPKEEAKHEEGILSQDEIDALLSGL